MARTRPIAKKQPPALSKTVIESMRASLETLEGAEAAIIPEVISRLEDEDKEFLGTLRAMVGETIKSNLRVIYRHSESPIEKLFWASLVLGFGAVDPFGAFFLSPVRDVKALIHDRNEEAKFATRLEKAHASQSHGEPFREWVRGRTGRPND